MAEWAKVKFFWETMLGSAGSTLTAANTETTGDYDVSYIYNMLETNLWKSSGINPVDFKYDAGIGNTKTADYLAIIGHNLGTVGGTVYLQYSDTGLWTGEQVTVSSFTPTDDKVILKEFPKTTGHRYWSFYVNAGIVVPEISLCIWGNKTELDWASGGFDPHEQNHKANINISETGYVLGIHKKFVEREMTLEFNDDDGTLYPKIEDWRDNHGLKNFFIAWDLINKPNEVFLMRSDKRHSNPFTLQGAARKIRINLIGRAE